MNLHEIIHQYLRMGPVDGGRWLLTLVKDAGLDRRLLKHIMGSELQRVCRLPEGGSMKKRGETTALATGHRRPIQQP